MNFFTLSALLLLGLQSFALAQTSPTPAQPMASPGVNMSHSAGRAPAHDDAQIVAIVKAANDTEIDAGKLAVKRAKRADVKAFAKEMIQDHSEANRKLAKVKSLTKMMSRENETSRGIRKMAAVSAKHLKSVKPADFDREYIDAQLSDHQQVLTALNEDLIPHAQNADLKNFLQDAKQMVSGHLEKAKKIQTAMTSGK
jgi:putative membrane protein